MILISSYAKLAQREPNNRFDRTAYLHSLAAAGQPERLDTLETRMKIVSHFDLQPTLVGETISLRPLITDDFEALYAAASDPLIWEQHPEPLRYQRQVFEGFFAGALASGGALLVTDKTSGEVIGTSRYYEWNPDQREVAIGYTFLVRSHWGGATNREMKQLMLSHAFRWAKVVWFHVGKNNWRSRRAMEKVGGKLSHAASREHNGVVHDYVFFKIEAPQ